MEDKLEKFPYSNQIARFINIVMPNWERAKVTQGGAEMAYFVLLSLIPIILLIANIIPLLPIDVSEVLNLLQTSLPEDIYAIIGPILLNYLNSGSGGVITIASIAAIWSASKVFSTMSRVLNEVYGEVEDKNFIVGRILSFLTMVLIVLLVFVAMFLFIFGEQILEFVTGFFEIEIPFIQELLLLRILVFVALLVAFFVIVYHFLPNHHLDFKYALPGAIFATLGWVLLSQFFSLYTSLAGGEMLANATIGGFIVLMIFLYFMNMILLLGALINVIVFELREGISIIDYEKEIQEQREKENSKWSGYPDEGEIVILRRKLQKIPTNRIEKGQGNESVKYFKDGLYLSRENNVYIIGLSEKGQYDIGEIMYVEISKHLDHLNPKNIIFSAEGAKSVSEISSPVSGQDLTWNTDLEDDPERLNSEDLHDRWIVKIGKLEAVDEGNAFDEPWCGQGKPEDS